jgi:hypothetical protein
MPLIERQDLCDAMTLGEDEYRGVRKPDFQVRISLDRFFSSSDIGGPERFQLVCSSRYFIEHRGLSLPTDMPQQEIVEFGQNKRRKKKWRRSLAKRSRAVVVVSLAFIERRK